MSESIFFADILKNNSPLAVYVLLTCPWCNETTRSESAESAAGLQISRDTRYLAVLYLHTSEWRPTRDTGAVSQLLLHLENNEMR